MFVNLHCLYYYRDTSTVCIHTCSKCLLLMPGIMVNIKHSPGKCPFRVVQEIYHVCPYPPLRHKTLLECEQLSPTLSSPPPMTLLLSPFSAGIRQVRTPTSLRSQAVIEIYELASLASGEEAQKWQQLP